VPAAGKRAHPRQELVRAAGKHASPRQELVRATRDRALPWQELVRAARNRACPWQELVRAARERARKNSILLQPGHIDTRRSHGIRKWIASVRAADTRVGKEPASVRATGTRSEKRSALVRALGMRAETGPHRYGWLARDPRRGFRSGMGGWRFQRSLALSRADPPGSMRDLPCRGRLRV
jgi:hypothetical protein